jgi:glutamyl/glutaminyl-tRNA synthetase
VTRKSFQILDALETWDAENISNANKEVGRELGFQMKVVNQVLRYAVAGFESGVGVHVIMAILGKAKVAQRLEACRMA